MSIALKFKDLKSYNFKFTLLKKKLIIIVN